MARRLETIDGSFDDLNIPICAPGRPELTLDRPFNFGRIQATLGSTLTEPCDETLAILGWVPNDESIARVSVDARPVNMRIYARVITGIAGIAAMRLATGTGERCD